MVKKILLLIIGILLLAGVLRFWQLGTTPPSLTWDEVAWGYNAYSLGIDGRDEFGRFLPYDYLESFGDFKPPVYAYLAVLPVKVFGLNEFAVRFPSAFFGTLTVLIAYLLTKRIFQKAPFGNTYALVTSLLLAISPWHIMLSRAAFEANVATFFLITGVWLFLEALEKKHWLLILSALSFVAAVYTFNSARIVAPLLVLGLTIGCHKKLFAIKKFVLGAGIIGMIFIVPIVPFLFSPQANLRFREVNIFSDISVIKNTNQEIINDHDAWWSKLIHNRRVAFGMEYFKHYYDNLSPAFLFITGDGNPKFSTQALGQLYVFELPFLLIGILLLCKKRDINWWLIPFWLLVAIIPAATARETPHALRTEGMLPMFQLLTAYGFVGSFTYLKKYQVIKIFAVCYLLFALFNVAYYLEDYYIHYDKTYSGEWQYGYKDAILYSMAVNNKYHTVYLTYALGRPYIYTLFYTHYPPALFRKNATINRDAFGFVTVTNVANYYFDKQLAQATGDKNILYIDAPVAVPQNAKIKKIFYLRDGGQSLVAYTL